ncbi:unnamed protein product [Ectocarpus sp. CCAP 1310/34]|nr:unnamed protein product [Ectocarpus sp. CCAP 1310/34]
MTTLGASGPPTVGHLIQRLALDHRQPHETAFDATREYVNNIVILFWQPPSIFSQWTPSTFSVDGVEYSCAEQFFAASKARHFGDKDMLHNIMLSSDPAMHKLYGRQVRGFTQQAWEKVKAYIVLVGTLEKFSHNPAMRQYLLKTGNSILAEASPFDNTRGIGMRADHPEAANPSNWTGKNLLGKALQSVRDLLRSSASLPMPPLEQPTDSALDNNGIHEINTDTQQPIHPPLESRPQPTDINALWPSDAPSDYDDDILHIADANFHVDNHPKLLAEHGPCLVDGLIQHSTSPYCSPIVFIPKKSGGLRITVNYQKLNRISSFSQLPVPRVDEIMNKLHQGSIFSLFDFTGSFHQWLKMPMGASQSSGWWMKVINEVIKNLEGVDAYLNDVVLYDKTPADHILTMRALLQRLRKHKLKLSPPKATIGTTNSAFLGHTITPDSIRPNANKVAALAAMPMPTDLKKLHSLLGGLSYYRSFVKNLSKRVRPVTTLKKNSFFTFTSDMEAIVREILKELFEPPILVFPDWKAIEDGTRPLRLHCDASLDDLGATLKQEQADGSVRPIVFISRSTLDAERNWTPLDLEAGAIVWAIKRLRRYLRGTHFQIWTDNQALENISKVGDHSPRVQRWLESLTAYQYTLKHRPGSSNSNADMLSRLPIPPSTQDITGYSRITMPDDVGVYMIRATGNIPSGPSPQGITLGGLVPNNGSDTLSGSPLTSADFQDFSPARALNEH